MKKRIYTDTSVIGGCLDIEFEEGSNRLFEEFKSGNNILLISNLVVSELENAPQAVKEILNQVPTEYI